MNLGLLIATVGGFALGSSFLPSKPPTVDELIDELKWGSSVAIGNGGRDCQNFELAIADPACGAHTRTAPARANEILRSIGELIPQQSPERGARSRAIIDLWYAHDDSAAITRAIVSFRELAATGSATAESWNDLAAALLTNHSIQASPTALIEALAASNAALQINRTSLQALWNRAVALTWLGLRDQQGRAWTDYEHVAHHRVSVNLNSDPLYMSPKDAAESGMWADISRMYIWNELLPLWSAGVLLEDSSKVSQSIDAVRTIAERSSDHDSLDSPSALLAVLVAPRSLDATRELARGFNAIRDVRTATLNFDWDGVTRALNAAEHEPAFQNTFERWISYEHGNYLLNRSRYAEAEASFGEMRRQISTIAPAVARRVAWGSALLSVTGERQALAVEQLSQVEQECSAANEVDCAIAAAAMRASAERALGEIDASLATAVHAVQVSATAPLSSRRWTSINQLRSSAIASGFGRAARDFELELDSLAKRLGRVDLQLLAARQRTESLLLNGELETADSVLRGFHAVWSEKANPSQQAEYLPDLMWIRGESSRLRGEPTSFVILDSASRLAISAGNRARAIPILVSRARAALARGDTVWALSQMDDLLGEMRSRLLPSVSLVADTRLADLMHDVSMDAARALLRQGARRSALAVLSGQPFTKRPADAPLYKNDVVIAVREVGDSLVIWRTAGNTDATFISPMAVSRWRSLVSRRDRNALTEMFDGAVKPWRQTARADSVQRIALDVRGVAGGIPWTALQDRTNGRYFIEDFEPHFVAKSLDVLSDETRTMLRPPAVTIVDAVPRSGPRQLPGAADEVMTLRTLWGGQARVVSGEVGMREFDKSKRSDVIHFAGHAILDNARPERSALLIPVAGGDSLVSVATISKWRLDGVSLVVLAACDTRATAGTPMSGLESIAATLRSVGAANVVGAGWPVDDRATAELMRLFHTNLRKGMSFASALRNAQLQFVRSPDPTRNAPGVWAAFQLLGS